MQLGRVVIKVEQTLMGPVTTIGSAREATVRAAAGSELALPTSYTLQQRPLHDDTLPAALNGWRAMHAEHLLG